MASINDIIKEWEIDSNIDKNEIIGESVKIPKLHNKYWKYYLTESAIFRALESKQKELEYNKWMLYTGKLSKEELDKLGWEQCDIKTLKVDVPRMLEADIDVQKIRGQIGVQKDKIDYIKAIIQSISNRSFIFGHIIEARKMEIGLT